MSSRKSLAERPASRCDIVGHNGAAVAGSDLEGQALAVEIGVALPVLPPVSRHGLPPCSRTFDGNCMHIAGSTDVDDEYEVEIGVPVDREPYPTLSVAGHPTKFELKKINK